MNRSQSGSFRSSRMKGASPAVSRRRTRRSVSIGPNALNAFVGRGSVEGRQRDVVLSEVHGQLTAMVDQVVEQNGAKDGLAWNLEEDLTVGFQHRELLAHRLVAHLRNALAARDDVRVEAREVVGGRLQWRRRLAADLEG